MCIENLKNGGGGGGGGGKAGRHGRDQEDRDSKPAWVNGLPDPAEKKPITKIGLVEWLKVKALSSKASKTHTHTHTHKKHTQGELEGLEHTKVKHHPQRAHIETPP
jgi:hypothetical protein